MNLETMQQIALDIHNKMDDQRSKDRKISKRTNNWASDLFHPCRRYLVYCRLNWKDKQLPKVETMYVFEDGNDIERKVKRDLEDVGYDVILAQEYFTWDEYEIAGKTDGKLPVSDGEKIIPFPLEIKSVAPFFWESTKTVEEIKEHPSVWVRRLLAQINLYCLMDDKEFGFLALKTFRKRTRIIPVQVDFELGEECLKTAEVVNKHVKENKIPDRILYNSSLCEICSFDHICQPLKTTKYDGAITEEDYKKLIRREETKAPAKEHDKLDKYLKKKYKGRNVLAGEFEITSKKYESTVFNVPDDIKKKYEGKEKRIRMDIKKVGE